MLDLARKFDQLATIYENYAEQMQVFQRAAVCKKGCDYCCTHYGNLDITTLEGLSILKHVERMPRPLQIRIQNAADRNKKQKEKRKPAKCPFLSPEKSCEIYRSRPLSCRQLYSIAVCDKSGPGPILHRQAVAVTRQYVHLLQELDQTGYSGHLTYILFLLGKPALRSTYLAGGYDPHQIAGFGKSHGIMINRVVTQSQTGTNYHGLKTSIADG
jgi:Fe-S-cluster containining protein